MVTLGVVLAACVAVAIVVFDANRGVRTFAVARGQAETFAPGEVQEGDQLTCTGAPFPSTVRVNAQSEQFGGWTDTSGLAYRWLEDGSLTLTCSALSKV